MHDRRLLYNLLSHSAPSNSVGQENQVAFLRKTPHLSHADLNSIRISAEGRLYNTNKNNKLRKDACGRLRENVGLLVFIF
jgi:hypothetical protein